LAEIVGLSADVVRGRVGEVTSTSSVQRSTGSTRDVPSDISISMTTNGIGLDKRIDELVDAGLTRVNISLDTVDRDHFARLTRRDRLPAVFAGIEAAKRAGMTPLKINAVL